MKPSSRSVSRIGVREQERKSSHQNGAWHPADIKAALEKRGISLAELSRRNGYHSTAAGRALRTSWPELERIIAGALEINPREIWPDRYTPDGVPIKYVTPRRQRREEGSRRTD